MEDQPNHLSEVLAQRYQALYDEYGQAIEEVNTIKQAIEEWQQQNQQKQLREDAKFFLVLTGYEMIYKAYAVSITKTGTDQLLPVFLNSDDTSTRIKESLEIILTDLADKPHLISGHEVMQSIDRNWDKLKSILIWA